MRRWWSQMLGSHGPQCGDPELSKERSPVWKGILCPCPCSPSHLDAGGALLGPVPPVLSLHPPTPTPSAALLCPAVLLDSRVLGAARPFALIYLVHGWTLQVGTEQTLSPVLSLRDPQAGALGTPEPCPTGKRQIEEGTAGIWGQSWVPTGAGPPPPSLPSLRGAPAHTVARVCEYE